MLLGLSRPLLTRIGLRRLRHLAGGYRGADQPVPAYIAAFVTGWFYFMVITSLSTILQERVDDAHRGRVMGLWMLGWAGLVPLGSLIGGPIIDAIGLTWVFLFGAVGGPRPRLVRRSALPEPDGPPIRPTPSCSSPRGIMDGSQP